MARVARQQILRPSSLGAYEVAINAQLQGDMEVAAMLEREAWEKQAAGKREEVGMQGCFEWQPCCPII